MIVHSKKNSGFTLLELIISITILALMALLLSRIFSESSQAVGLGKDQAMLDESARLVLDYAEQDISQALIRTNVAFRVHTIDNNDALYFVSTAVRRQLEHIRRDTAPMRFQASAQQENSLAQSISIQSPDASAGTTSDDLSQLIRQSDYYQITTRELADFQPAKQPETTMATQRSHLTFTGTMDETFAVLTFMDIFVNAKEEQSGTPRFVDLIIGLASSTTINQAQQAQDAGNHDRASTLLDQNELIYSRRIYMRNTGVDQLKL